MTAFLKVFRKSSGGSGGSSGSVCKHKSKTEFLFVYYFVTKKWSARTFSRKSALTINYVDIYGDHNPMDKKHMCYLHKGMVFNFQDLFFYFIVIIFVVGDIEKKNVFFPCLLFSYILEESRYKKGNTQKTFFIKRLHEEAMHLYMRPYTPLNAPLLDWISKCCIQLVFPCLLLSLMT